jgi:hypothetical protein
VWTPGSGTAPGTLFALGLGADATINIDCDVCTAGTHAKIIANSDCSCSSALSYNASARQIGVDACAGMCLTDGIAPGALKSCAGDEPWQPTQLHLAPCSDPSTLGAWTRVVVPPGTPIAAADASAPVATLVTFGAYLNARP